MDPAPADPLGGGTEFYESIRYLGGGTFGSVWLARERASGNVFALKFIDRQDQMTNHLLREILNHSRLQHDHVVFLHRVFLHEKYLVLVLEHVAGGTLFSVVRESRTGIADAAARWYFAQILFGVDYCHQKGICNRDIKLENTLIGGPGLNIVKVCDFGLSKDANYHSAPKSRTGTPCYMAPEVFAASENEQYDGFQADVWSLGVLLYTMLHCAFPFADTRVADATGSRERLAAVMKRIKNAEYSFPETSNASEGARDLIRKIFVADPQQRLTLAQVIQHPWCAAALPEDVAARNAQRIAEEVRSGRAAQSESVRAEVERMMHDNQLFSAEGGE